MTAAVDQKTYDVFLSYARSDRPIAHALAEELRGRGLRVWTDIELQPGQEWLAAIRGAVERSSAIAVLVSAASSNSTWLGAETALALSAQEQGRPIKVIPIVIGHDLEIPFFLRQFQGIFLESPQELPSASDAIVRSLRSPNEFLEGSLLDRADFIDRAREVLDVEVAHYETARLSKSRELQIRFLIGLTLTTAIAVMIAGAVLLPLRGAGTSVNVILIVVSALLGSAAGYFYRATAVNNTQRGHR